MRGQYIQHESGLILPNTVPNEGEESFLKMLFRDDRSDLATNWFIGVTSVTPDNTTVLSDITDEPTTGGYARQEITPDLVGWPTISSVNGVFRTLSKLFTFAAVGADYDQPFTRFFMASVASGAGILYSISAPYASSITLLDGQSTSWQYELFLN